MRSEAIPETFARRLPPVNDRMLTTCFLAALVHGIVILGVSFSLPKQPPSDAAPSLEVTLVSEQGPRLKENRRAHYLAQRSQHGSGNSKGRERASIPRSSRVRGATLGLNEGSGSVVALPGTDGGATRLLASTGASAQILYFAHPRQPNQPTQLPELLQDRPNIGIAPNSDDEALRLRGETRGELWITADTQESDIAVYLDAWRRKVENVGTLNFPTMARSQELSGTPVVEVAIAASGKLTYAAIRRSSGHAELDQAALGILKMAAPFDAFPKALSRAHDQIRFAYEWQFIKGVAQGSNVLAPPGPATPVKP
ncbi:MAG: TonB family protein [Proteobacteria bacterium]|nr:TonB family protein [Pseudomonadota bacterium]